MNDFDPNKPNTAQSIDLVDLTRRLRAVTRRIEGFFDSQSEKLKQAMNQMLEQQSQHDVNRRLANDLNEQQQIWQREKQLETQRLLEAGEALANAWQDLETQQKQMFMAKCKTEKLLGHTQFAEVAAANNEPQESSVATLFERQLLQRQAADYAAGKN